MTHRMDEQRQTHGLRGDELADDPGPPGSAPDPDDLGTEGIRGDGLADDAGTGPEAGPDPDHLAEQSVRGDGLAEGA
jgi:hypothetical protein